MTAQALEARTCIVRNTASGKGRLLAVAPGITAARHLHYGPIVLDADTIRFETGERETGLICLNGSAEVSVDSRSHTLGRYDTLYVPCDSALAVTPGSAGKIPVGSANPPGSPVASRAGT